jgi:hypothetical protein
LHCLVLDGVYRRGANGVPEFVEVLAPTYEALRAVSHKIARPLPSMESTTYAWFSGAALVSPDSAGPIPSPKSPRGVSPWVLLP